MWSLIASPRFSQRSRHSCGTGYPISSNIGLTDCFRFSGFGAGTADNTARSVIGPSLASCLTISLAFSGSMLASRMAAFADGTASCTAFGKSFRSQYGPLSYRTFAGQLLDNLPGLFWLDACQPNGGFCRRHGLLHRFRQELPISIRPAQLSDLRWPVA